MLRRYLARRGALPWCKLLAYWRISAERRERGLGVRWRKSFKREPFLQVIHYMPWRRP